MLGTWGGAVTAVLVDEANPDIAYVARPRRPVLFDISDPQNIIQLGSIDLGSSVRELKVRDGHAYVGAYR